MENSPKILIILIFLFTSFGSPAQLALENSPATSLSDTSLKRDLNPPRTDLLRTHTGDFIFGPATRIKFKIIEEESGLETTYFKVDDLPFMKSDGRQMLPHDLADGEYKMLYYSVDKQGNQEQIRTDIIFVDKEGPEVTPSFNDTPVSFENGIPVFTKDVNLIIEVADKKVDVQKVSYQINDGLKVESSDLHTIDLSEVLSKIEEETIKIEVRAYDAFYNISKEVIEFKLLR
ncbi:hypothetical protein AAOE16_11905 [Ekhidna sp. MALMAid0563]|uniref:hypothetical protein n=1 Tax=Ekhidna sp. MALMAid0563 TaxID=3143937 RepID=UPI0032DE6937